jgi:hypothetical protein
MARDENTTGFKATLTVSFIPVNKYGDELAQESVLVFMKVLPVKTLSEITAILETIK